MFQVTKKTFSDVLSWAIREPFKNYLADFESLPYQCDLKQKLMKVAAFWLLACHSAAAFGERSQVHWIWDLLRHSEPFIKIFSKDQHLKDQHFCKSSCLPLKEQKEQKPYLQVPPLFYIFVKNPCFEETNQVHPEVIVVHPVNNAQIVL